MKKLILSSLLLMFAFTVANAETEVELGLSGDVYYITDNHSGLGLGERPFAASNIFKDRIGTNNILLEAAASGDVWRTKFAIAHFGDGHIIPEEANVGFNLFEGLWIEGGYFANWDADYTYNLWFTGNSITDYFSMGTPYLALGLSYEIGCNTSISAGVMNNGFISEYEEGAVNQSKSIYAKFDAENLFSDWNLTASFLTGNIAERHYYAGKWHFPNHENQSEIFLNLAGSVVENLEAQVTVKYFMLSSDEENVESANLLTAQLQARYRFNEKFAAGFRFAYAMDNKEGHFMGIGTVDKEGNPIGSGSGIDIGLVCEYNPTDFTYIRLEGGMLSLSNSEDENVAKKIFDGEASRMYVGLSMGWKLNLFHHKSGKASH